MATRKITLEFGFDYETKNTVRFKELDKDGTDAENPTMGKVYVKKEQLEKPEWGSPKTLKVTVEPGG